jgi:hypothetical protein
MREPASRLADDAGHEKHDACAVGCVDDGAPVGPIQPRVGVTGPLSNRVALPVGDVLAAFMPAQPAWGCQGGHSGPHTTHNAFADPELLHNSALALSWAFRNSGGEAKSLEDSI